MKKTLLLTVALALLGAVAVAGCNKSSSTDENPAVNTNAAAPGAAGQSASKAWQDTKSAATNAWNATKIESTNIWNKTTNAVRGGKS